MFECRALRIRGRHAPVALERSTSGEERNFGSEPPYKNVDSEVSNNSLVTETESQACVHDKHAHFDGVNDVEHRLL